MKKYRKKEMLETISDLEEKNSYFRNNNARATRVNDIDTLISCQESAILLGSYLDILGEQAKPLVKILEDYCENIYQMTISLSDESLCRKLSERIKEQLSQLNNSILYDLPEDKKEVVFLPYKASMWDSLESIWKAADEDESCDAYVIPIPYYDKNPDGSFREMYYEGGHYPDYVPITKYEEYDFEGRKPDVIFIHNPYDGSNYVTSVHPFFYSKNLKQFTDKLIYIPYFILDEFKPDDKTVIDKIKHLCTTSGVFYADKVIVQSEDMKKVYVNVLAEVTGNTKKVRQYWEDKILGLGSPKVDKALNTKREDLSIPDEWLKVIQRPDGSFKKIIFYNTCIGPLLQSGNQMLRKLKSVFATFEENKNEVVLLWRPHPLIESTLTSMRPQLWEEYKTIRDKYIQEGWGIYDNTADMNRAVVLSDAYYGDESSIAQLYKKLNKLILFQTVS